jgi:hypothetical protein
MSVDFSQKAITSMAKGQIFQHPATVWPIALSIPATLAAVLIFHLGLLGLIVFGTGVGAGIFSWGINRFYRYDHFAGLCAKNLRAEMEKQGRESIKEMKEGFERCNFPSGVAQIDELESKFNNFRRILQKRFNEGELTYVRYLGIVEQTYFAVLDNLSDILILLEGVSTINKKDLEGQGDKKTAREQLEIYAQELGKIEIILEANQKAFTEITRVTSAVAEVRTTKGKASMDMETAMLELQNLASRARNYSVET